MASIYPSVQQSAKQASKAPVNYPRVPKPANDNKMGTVKVAKVPRAARPKPVGFPSIPGLLAASVTVWADWAISETKAQIQKDEELNPWSGFLDKVQVNVNPEYWNLICRTGTPTTGRGSSGASSPYCNLDRLVYKPTWWTGFPTTVSNPYFITYRYDRPNSPPNNYEYWKSVEYWQRKSGAPVPTPVIDFPWVPVAPPVPQPWRAPVSAPLARPYMPPAPAPWQAPQPWEQPSTHPQPKKQPASRPVTVPVRPPFFMAPNLPVPWVPPSSVIEVTPGGEVTVTPGNDFGKDEPPDNRKGGREPPRPRRRKTKENKVKMKPRVAAAIGLVWAGVNGVTEGIDFVLAMYDALEDEWKLPPGASRADALAYMMTNFDAWGHVDVAKAIENYTNMQIGDAVSAFGSNAVKDVSQQTGSVTGLDRLLREGQDALGVNESPIDAFEEWFDNLPALDYDDIAGAFVLSGTNPGLIVE